MVTTGTDPTTITVEQVYAVLKAASRLNLVHFATGLIGPWQGEDGPDFTQAAEAVLAQMNVKACPRCGQELMAPNPIGEPGDDSYYCEHCGTPWSLDLSKEML
jgi:hypothetical protein